MMMGCRRRVTSCLRAVTSTIEATQNSAHPPHVRSFSVADGAPLSKDARIGWIGTGVMGRWMCEHVMRAGYDQCTVYNRTMSKAEPLIQLGAKAAETPRQVAENSDVVFTIVGYPADVEHTYLGDNGVINHLRSGGVIVDMTTSRPSLAQTIYDAAAERGISSLDAPVSGGDIGARNAALSIMVGGDQKVFNSVLPCFDAMGKNVNFMGDSGCGQHTKMANQILIASGMTAMVECLLYAEKAGLDLSKTIAAVGSGSAGSWSVNNYGPRIVKRDFKPGFFVEHFVKDLGIALEECRRLNLHYMPGLALAEQLYRLLNGQGGARKGTQALQLIYERINQMEK